MCESFRRLTCNFRFDPRQTYVATRELLELTALMPSVELSVSANDTRVLRSNNKTPTSRDHYLVFFQAYPDDPFNPDIWRSYSLQKCKFFLWLLHRKRLRTKARLLHCHMHNDGACPFCTSEEDCFHLFINCSCGKSFWSFIGLDFTSLPAALGVD